MIRLDYRQYSWSESAGSSSAIITPWYAFHDLDEEDKALIVAHAAIVQSVDEIDSLTFDIYPTNAIYDDITPFSMMVRAIDTGNDDKLEFSGRVIGATYCMDENGLIYKHVTCESSEAVLIDQCVDPREGGIWVRFFGRPVPVSGAPAFFAAKGSMPIFTAWSRPLKDGRWRCEVIASYPAGSAKDMWPTTQRCIADLEKTIRRHPSCWILNYRYFRKKVPQAELEKLEKREKSLAQKQL